VKHSPRHAYDAAEVIKNGDAVFGCELGSTRIKATLIGPDTRPLAGGSHSWENKLQDGIWTYDLSDVWVGVAACFADLAADVEKTFGLGLTSLAAGGFSGMMHGYLALDHNGNLLVPFRTWRNNMTGQAATQLAELFGYPIPQRWTIAHLYQAILNGEEHVGKVAYLTTLAGYVHWRLTGQHVVGICEASGMFPVEPRTKDYDAGMLAKFDQQVAPYRLPWKLRELLPTIVAAGEVAGTVTKEGAQLLDPSGKIQPNIPLCPPEGDAGTGMVATNSIHPRSGNVSAGTSVFAALVLEKKLSKVHPEIDLVLTPDGKLVGLAHSNNCTSDFDAWVSLFVQAFRLLGIDVGHGDLIARLMPQALRGDADAGGLLSYGYISGEHVTGFSEGRPLFVRKPESPLTLGNFVRAHLFSSLCALRMALNILTEDEGTRIDEMRGHGGFFKSAEAAQRIMAAAINTPISVLETAGEGGPWGMALLAAYARRSKREQTLASFLEAIFAATPGRLEIPDPNDVRGFAEYFRRYTEGLSIEAAAVETLR
jgi:sugar (pentulose or hexulose) kinase